MKRFISHIVSSTVASLLVLTATTLPVQAATHTELASDYVEKLEVVKSGTPALIRLLREETAKARAFKAAYTEAERPSLDTYADSEKGIFRVHYDLSGNNAPDPADTDKNGIPDYVDSTLVYLEYAWQVIVNDLGYGQPRYDGTLGGLPRDMLDCYLIDLEPQRVYGMTYPDNLTGGSSSSYITVDNDFPEDTIYKKSIYNTTGYDALKITTAHEFFHVVHYSYYGAYDSLWWMEQSAVWLEDRAWDTVNDYLNYIGFLYTDRDIPLDSSDGNFMYGATLFAFYIAEKFGETKIRSLWDTFKHKQSGDIENLNAILPVGLPEAISEFAVWLYFTGYRANSEDFFRDADFMKQVMKADKTTTVQTAVDSLTFRHYTFKYIDIAPADGIVYGDSLYVSFIDRDGGIWSNKVIFYNTPYNYEVVDLDGTRSAVAVSRPFDRMILVIANASKQNKYYRYVYSTDVVSAKGVKKEPVPEPFALKQNYPNPFNSSTTIPFSVDTVSRITLRIVDLRGATVAVLVDDVLGPGEYVSSFNGDSLSSGTYFAILESGGKSLSSKMLFLK